MYDALIIGGGAAGMSCALVLGSAKGKPFTKEKRVGIVMHQKASHLQSALFNNVLGLSPKTTGEKILKNGRQHLSEVYAHIEQIHNEKVVEVAQEANSVKIITNKNTYQSKIIVVAIGYTNNFDIKGLETHIIPHQKAKPEKERIELKNNDHLVTDRVYVAGTLAGWRSQFAIACGSGAAVATDILTLWNDDNHVKIHDKVS